MPLLDHFHEPLVPARAWESFHAQWAGSIAAALNRDLPRPQYFAATQVHVGTRVEADVAEFESAPGPGGLTNGAASGVAVGVQTLPVTQLAMPLVFPDDFEVQVFDTRGGARLVAVVELVSPGNKDREERRRAFAMKSAAYLHRGIGLIVVDVVTERQFNLHNELVALLGQADVYRLPVEAFLYAVAYRPVYRNGSGQADLWPVPLAVAQPLPRLPLALRGNGAVLLDLEATYSEARARDGLG
jgi:hypothetical protein